MRLPLKIFIASLTLTLVSACSENDSPSVAPTSSAAVTAATAPDLSSVVAAVEPSVVTVLTSKGQGSGVVYQAGGVIVTNEHVVRGSTTVEIALADGSRTPGRVAATDESTDLAVIRAERTNLPPAKFQTALPRPGQTAIAMGSPLGFEGSVSAGIISGLGRGIPGSAGETRSLVDLIQTDAAISPGNSGGALVNGQGEVVGINEAYLPPSTGAVSIGFAIPSAVVVDTVDELLKNGRAEHAYLGVVPGSLTPQIAEALNIEAGPGVVVLDVSEGSPAATAGIRRGDVITKMGDQPVTTVEGLLGALRPHDPGESITVELRRGAKTESLTVKLAELPAGG
jgi:S1-C subfamily serine protease